jgi:SAM-dependent methyltransferase
MKAEMATETKDLLRRILQVSLRVSLFAPPMKPFVRFSAHGKTRAANGVPRCQALWDFDDLLQKQLLGLVREVASPDAVARLCVEQWKGNLGALYEGQRQALEQTRRDGTEYPFHFDRRTELVAERIKPGGRLLYIGCGSGKECLHYAKAGLRVIGIDTMTLLLSVAKGWAAHLTLPVDFTCMDAMNLGLAPGSFDGFLFEFYGFLPSFYQILALQRGLATILHPGGHGFIVAQRKRYGSYWFRMGNRYPPAMTNWLIPHASADFLFSTADGCEERLSYGLYNRSHTVQSLSAELEHTFDVLDCFYEDDPRYVIAIVQRRKDAGFHDVAEMDDHDAAKQVSLSSLPEIENTLKKMEALCDWLEVHAQKVATRFTSSETPTNDCLEALSISIDTPGFMDLLVNILALEHTALSLGPVSCAIPGREVPKA